MMIPTNRLLAEIQASDMGNGYVHVDALDHLVKRLEQQEFRLEDAPALLCALAFQYHAMAWPDKDSTQHGSGSWATCPSRWCRMAQPFGKVTPTT